MNILDKIIEHKKLEVAAAKKRTTIAELEARIFYNRPRISLKESLLKENSSGIIAEFKRRSPSKGDIFAGADAVKITKGYQNAGAAGLSILTDRSFFGGAQADLLFARPNISIPILRKDFIIDEYQLIEARSIGADVILLIAECLDKSQFSDLAQAAKSLGLEILMEIHSTDQLEKYNNCIDMVGVNNRNLKTFEVSIQTSLDIAKALPENVVKISESGISKAETCFALREAGFKGFLIGENFMKTGMPGKALREFLSEK
jgi:indole-3-glycerol phosphate synthase